MNNILGCFISITSGEFGDSGEVKNLKRKEGELFKSYIWGEKGISDILKKLNHQDYGQDLKLILFQFYVNPIPYLLQALKPIEPYRKNEKSIGIPIIINYENFFSKTEILRYDYLQESILQQLDLLSEAVKKKKLDTDTELLKSNVKEIFNK